MKIVITIPDKEYKILVNPYQYNEYLCSRLKELVRNGTPLPKGYGRLIDADKTLATAWTNFYKHEDEWEKKDNDYFPIGRMYDQNGFECCQQTIVNAPTIIEADNEEIRTSAARKCEKCAEEHRQLAEWLKDLKQLREVTSQPKMGHWIVNEWGNISCSECGCTALYDKVYPGESVFGKAVRVKSTFCPTCGAKMQESEG